MYKSLLIAKKEIPQLIRVINDDKLKLIPQIGKPFSFNKRSPEDGIINFEVDTTNDIVNLIRGVTKPFPGAYCFTKEKNKIVIWEAWAFDQLLDFSAYQPGEVIDVLYNMPIVKTIDGSIILKHYEGTTLLPQEKLSVK